MKQQNYSPWLEDYTKQYITPEISPVPRYIVAAANYHRELGILLVGSRHWSRAMQNQLSAMSAVIRDTESSQFEQGFIDQYDQFVNREEAKHIAITNGQKLIRENWGELYSENLY